MFALIFDTETTGVVSWKEPSVSPVQPNLVQLGALLVDMETRQDVACIDLIVYPESWEIPDGAAAVHGIPTERAKQLGVHLENAVLPFRDLVHHADLMVAHNIRFDKIVMERASAMVSLAQGADVDYPFTDKKLICTMMAATPIVKVKSKRPMHANDFKWPKLVQCTQHFFGEDIENAHSAIVDVRACKRVFFELLDRGAFKSHGLDGKVLPEIAA